MSTRIAEDASQPVATVEWAIQRPLPDFDLDDVQAAVPRDVDPILASQGFKDLLDEVRAILEPELLENGLEILQLTGAICADGPAYRPGIWLVVREIAGNSDGQISQRARERLAQAADIVRTRLNLS